MCKSKARLGAVLLFNVIIISDKSRFDACRYNQSLKVDSHFFSHYSLVKWNGGICRRLVAEI